MISAETLQTVCKGCGAAVCAVLYPRQLSLERLSASYSHWGSHGNSGALPYIDDKLSSICDPFGSRPWAKSALIIAFKPRRLKESPLLQLPRPVPGAVAGIIAAYALEEDYHITGHRILENTALELGHHDYEICVDSSPVPEKYLGCAAGIGVTAPNSMLRIHGCGCGLNLGVLFTSLELPETSPGVTPEISCGNCMKCRKVCPNNAMAADGTLLVKRCRSYLAGGKRGPLEWKEQLLLKSALFGCSLCSNCCPESSRDTADLQVDALELLRMPAGELKRIIADTPLAHSGPTVLKRNAAAILAAETPPQNRAELIRSLSSLTNSPAVLKTLDNALSSL